MFKVLIADDERIIREGLGGAIDWEAFGFSVCGLASDGTAAFELMEKFDPELVVLDIKMPGMDGLELISKARETGLNANFVILSGYSEFDYAKRAMGLGVKYYLTKPCQEQDLISTVKSAGRDIRSERNRKAMLEESIRKYGDSLPDAEDRLLQKAISGERESEETENFWELFGMRNLKIRILVFRFEKGADFKARLELRDLTAGFTRGLTFSRCILYRDDAVLVVSAAELNEARELKRGLAEEYRRRHPDGLSAACSAQGGFESIRGMYLQAAACVACRLELDEPPDGPQKPVFHFIGEQPADLKAILGCIRGDGLKNIEAIVTDIFMRNRRHDFRSVGLCLCLNLLFETAPGKAFALADKVCDFPDPGSFRQTVLHTTALILEIAAQGRGPRAEQYSSTTQKAVRYIEHNLDRSSLSLSRLSRDVLFMNEDYIGKLFVKETGKKFSRYVSNRRICRAITLFRSGRGEKIYEVCAKSGFGANTQYFSQVFKKQTGFTPSEFRKIP